MGLTIDNIDGTITTMVIIFIMNNTKVRKRVRSRVCDV